MTVDTWLDALITTNKEIEQFQSLNVGDQTIITALVTVQLYLTNAVNESKDPVNAFGTSVKAVENFAINDKSKYSYPQAHAVCIWMRVAYEGMKLKLPYILKCKIESFYIYSFFIIVVI